MAFLPRPDATATNRSRDSTLFGQPEAFITHDHLLDEDVLPYKVVRK